MSFFVLILAYFIGAIPFGVLVGRACGVDVQSVGSGNIGTTNVWRALGPKMGATVFLLDVLKGTAASLLARTLVPDNQTIWALAMFVVVLGHTFSVFLKFKGGKGVATAFGAMLGVVPAVALGCFAWWGLVLLLSRTISVASIAVCFAAPIGAVYVGATPITIGVISLFCVVGLVKHLPNVKRIIAGTEPKVGQKKSATSSTRLDETAKI
jgi:glycerol-3-phosphate acyltransferase PlsY